MNAAGVDRGRVRQASVSIKLFLFGNGQLLTTMDPRPLPPPSSRAVYVKHDQDVTMISATGINTLLTSYVVIVKTTEVSLHDAQIME